MEVNAIWIGDQLPLLQSMCLNSWVKHGYRVNLWCYDSFVLPDGVTRCDAREILPLPIICYEDTKHAGSPVLHANLFRYKFLAERGGCFIDADTLCLASFVFVNTFFSSEGDSKHPNLAFTVSSGLSQPLFQSCYDEACQRLHTKKWGLFGPKLLHQKINEFRLHRFIVEPHVFCPINWSESGRIFDETPPSIDRALGCHLWQQIFTKHGRDLDAEYPPTSLWEKWKREYRPACIS